MNLRMSRAKDRASRRGASLVSIVAALAFGAASGPAFGAGETDPATPLRAAVMDAARSPKFIARDSARHPLEELSFFEVRPHSHVIEILPGGGYWTEILAPYLRQHGTYTAALPSGGTTDAQRKEAADEVQAFQAKVSSSPDRYGLARSTSLGDGHADIAPAGSADIVLTFRNLHNWMEDGTADAVLASFFRALKPGGILGIEDHRGNTTRPQDPKAADGYVRQQTAIDLAQRAGFRFVAASEINANPKDTADWPKGVWTLPPTLTLGDQDRARYQAIGEADNFVLKFQKP